MSLFPIVGPAFGANRPLVWCIVQTSVGGIHSTGVDLALMSEGRHPEPRGFTFLEGSGFAERSLRLIEVRKVDPGSKVLSAV